MKRHNSQSVNKSSQLPVATRNDSAALIARDTALAQLRTAVVVLRNTANASEQITNLQLHIQSLLNGPEEMLWLNYVAPNSNFVPSKPRKARDQLSIIQKALLLIGMEIGTLYVDNSEEKSWVLDWGRGKKARLFWTKSAEWTVTLYLGQGNSYATTGFKLDDFLKQVGVDSTWWSSEW